MSFSSSLQYKYPLPLHSSNPLIQNAAINPIKQLFYLFLSYYNTLELNQAFSIGGFSDGNNRIRQ